MKKIFYFASVAMILITCQKRYFTSSPEIDLVKKANEAYFKGVLTSDQLIDTLKAGITNYSEYKAGENPDYENPLYEMIVDDEGGKWVHCWLTWLGKTKNGIEVVTPVHLSSHIKENKVVIHFIYVNALPGYLAIQTSDSNKVVN